MSICVLPFLHAIPSSVSLPLVVGMMGATKNIEQHPEERDHPHKEPTLNNPQCHGSRLPFSMDLPGVFMNTWADRPVLSAANSFSLSVFDRLHIHLCRTLQLLG